jgi:hypothetical protein
MNLTTLSKEALEKIFILVWIIVGGILFVIFNVLFAPLHPIFILAYFAIYIISLFPGLFSFTHFVVKLELKKIAQDPKYKIKFDKSKVTIFNDKFEIILNDIHIQIFFKIKRSPVKSVTRNSSTNTWTTTFEPYIDDTEAEKLEYGINVCLAKYQDLGFEYQKYSSSIEKIGNNSLQIWLYDFPLDHKILLDFASELWIILKTRVLKMDIRDEDLDIINNLKIKRDIDGLLKLLKSTDVKVVIKTICVLSEFKDSKIIGPLIKLLNHNDNKVRESVVLALGELKDSKAFKPLVEALNDDDYSVKKSSITALVKLNGRKAYSHIEKKLRDNDSSISKYAAEALVEIDERKAHRTLINSIDLKVKNYDEDIKDSYSLLKGGIIISFTVIVIVRLVLPDSFNIIKISNEYLKFFIHFVIFFLLGISIPVIIIFKDIFKLKDEIRIEADGFLIYAVDFGKIFKEKISKLYKINKPEWNSFHILVPDKKRKLRSVVISFWGSRSDFGNDLIIFIEEFRLLDEDHQKTIMKIIEESYFKYLITPI